MEQMNKTPEQAEQHSGETTRKDLSTKLGEAIGAILCLCATATVVALTTKFIFWLF